MAPKIKRGDQVQIIAGRDKGKTGKVIRVLNKKNLLVVEGANQVVRHVSASARRNVRQTGRINVDAPLSISNVILVDENNSKMGRVGWRELKDKTKIRSVKGKR